MGATSTIEWTDATWNPITGCTLMSEGCRHCYAALLAATRLKNHASRAGLARLNAAGEAKFTGEVRFNREWLMQPLEWKRPRRIFVCAHGDLFHESVPDAWIDEVVFTIAKAQSLGRGHIFQILTKRPDRMRRYWEGVRGRLVMGVLALSGPLTNVWLGTSFEDQATANLRVRDLLATPAVVRFGSAEPLLGPLELTRIVREAGGERNVLNALAGAWQITDGDHFRCGPANKLDWLIVGGESGPKARPMHPDWVRSLRDQCAAAGVPFFFKQWGEFHPSEQHDPGLTKCTATPEAIYISGAREWRPSERLHLTSQAGNGWAAMCRLGKKLAGRLLDGVAHDGMPS